MRMFVLAGFVASILVSATQAQDAPQAPTPTKEHQLLKQFAGEWVTEGDFNMGPDQPTVTAAGTESTRLIGEFWSITEYKGDFQGVPFNGVMTIGYDPEKKKYVGTWVCSMCHMLTQYEGTMNEDGTVLTLHTEGIDPTNGKTVKMRDVLEMKDKDHKLLTSYALGEDGKWHQFMSLTARRK